MAGLVSTKKKNLDNCCTCPASFMTGSIEGAKASEQVNIGLRRNGGPEEQPTE
jgi:hypothetical protein